MFAGLHGPGSCPKPNVMSDVAHKVKDALWESSNIAFLAYEIS